MTAANAINTTFPLSNFVNGEWLGAHSKESFPVTNPANGQLIARVPDSLAEDARLAVDAAYAALPAWRCTSAKSRSQVLQRWHTLIMEHESALANCISTEQGKPIAESVGEVRYAAAYVEWFAEEAKRIHGDVIARGEPDRRMTVLKEPVGVVAAITPWNFPAAMITRKMAPALAAGCTVVAKPAEDTPLTMLFLADLLRTAGLPAGVVNVVTASRDRTPEVVGQWLADARVRKITFTGSTPVGKLLARESAANLKRLSLELGGNAPFIVFEDANLEEAVEGLIQAKFRNGGQTCISPNRVYVQASVYDAFVERLVPRVAALKVGPACDAASQIGPMINVRAVAKIKSHIDDACAHGAKIAVGGSILQMEGVANYFAPTVLTEATEDMRLAHEETFGPVVALFRFGSEEEAIRKANATPFGLAAYFYTENARRVARLPEKLEAGILGINAGLVTSEAAPFGGIKESGYGREGSRIGLDDYLQTKYCCQGSVA